MRVFFHSTNNHRVKYRHHVKRNHTSHLLHEQSGQDRPAQQTDPARHLARLLPRRQDRRARS